MNKEEKTYVWLSTFDFLHNKRIEKLVSLFGTAKDIFDKLESKKDDVIDIVGGDKNYNMMLYARSEEFLSSYLSNLKKDNIQVITRASDCYPKRLLEVDMPPYVLYCKGNIKLLEEEQGIAIVGTRTPSSYGKTVTELFAKNLAKSGFIIISGMASGVDSISHRCALEQNKPTIAVLAGGFNHIYPALNVDLSKKIENNGLLVTEYKPSYSAQSFNFCLRNRIIAGLSKGVLITEAGERSGSLHTKNYALDAGRDVFAVPGPITNSMCAGTNGIIKRGNGHPVTEPDDILRYYEIETHQIQQQKFPQLSLDEMLIYQILKNEEIDFESLQEKTCLDTKMLNSCLTSMQISGIIKKLPGNKFVII